MNVSVEGETFMMSKPSAELMSMKAISKSDRHDVHGQKLVLLGQRWKW